MPIERDLSVTTEDHQVIQYDHYRYGHKNAVVLAHGFFNSKNAHLLKELGDVLRTEYDVIIFDFRGHGKSPGLYYWTAKEYLDLSAVLKNIRGEYAGCGVVGFSLGAAASIMTAVKTVLIDSLIAVSSPTEFGKIEFRFWELDFENDVIYNIFGKGWIGKGVRPGPFWLKKEKPVHLVMSLKNPVLYIHGDKDWIIKPWHSQKLFENTSAPKKLAIIKNGPHAEYLIRKNKEETVSLIRSWFTQTLK